MCRLPPRAAKTLAPCARSLLAPRRKHSAHFTPARGPASQPFGGPRGDAEGRGGSEGRDDSNFILLRATVAALFAQVAQQRLLESSSGARRHADGATFYLDCGHSRSVDLQDICRPHLAALNVFHGPLYQSASPDPKTGGGSAQQSPKQPTV